MDTNPKAFSASCAIHFGITGILLFATYKGSEKTPKPEEIFELIAAPIPADPNVRHVTSPHNAPPMPAGFKLERIREIPIKLADPEPEEPAPSRVPDKTTAKTPDKTAPKDPTKPGKTPLSYKEFAQTNPSPTNPTSKNPKTAKGQPAPQIFHIPGSIDGPKMATPNQGALNIPIDPAEEQIFFSQLTGRIKQAWRKPPSYSLLECKVGFDISATGAISNICILKQSGDSAFDQSAMDALRAVGSAGRPPGGKAMIGNSIPFNLKD